MVIEKQQQLISKQLSSDTSKTLKTHALVFSPRLKPQKRILFYVLNNMVWNLNILIICDALISRHCQQILWPFVQCLLHFTSLSETLSNSLVIWSRNIYFPDSLEIQSQRLIKSWPSCLSNIVVSHFVSWAHASTWNVLVF